ncbi:MAG: cupin domain-containing protein [Pseudomonadota bacterium]
MSAEQMLKNIPFAEPQAIADLVAYHPGQVVSRTLAQNPMLSLTLFALAQGEGISAHTVPADALVVILDGAARVTIGEKTLALAAGQCVAMPHGVPHALDADQPFKMLLVVVRQPQQINL